jgi:hypothetical protein
MAEHGAADVPASVAYSDGARSVTYQLTKRCMVIGRRTSALTADIEVPAEVFPDMSRQYALFPSSPNSPEMDGLKVAGERTERQTYVLIYASLTRMSIRHSSCGSPAVACRHAEIVLNGEDWLLQPISANRTVHNPTFRNGQPVVGPCKLAPGDTITLGAPLRALPADPVSAHAEALPEDSHAQARQPTRLAKARLSHRGMSADACSLV